MKIINKGVFTIKKSKNLLIIILGIVILMFYLYYTYPTSIDNLVNTDSISIINVAKLGKTSTSIKNVTIENKNEIKDFLEILQDYKYKKIFKINNPNVIESNTSDSKLIITIHYADKKNQPNVINFFIDSNSKIKIDSRNFILKGKDRKLFDRIQSYYVSKEK